ncbi:hypothetical protein D3C83_219310 [compost metagenome]
MVPCACTCNTLFPLLFIQAANQVVRAAQLVRANNLQVLALDVDLATVLLGKLAVEL